VDLKSFIAGAQNFLKETRTEGKKVVWPSRQYILAATIIILVIVIVLGIFVTLIDFAFAQLFSYLIRS